MALLRPALLALALVAGFAVAGCGGNSGDSVNSSSAVLNAGGKLFAERCSGCHTLSVVGAEGSATKINDRERPDGPNFNVRKECYGAVMYAIQNGGFSGAIMPANIVVGPEAKAVSAFLQKYSGQDAKTQPSVTGKTATCPPLAEAIRKGPDAGGATGGGMGSMGAMGAMGSTGTTTTKATAPAAAPSSNTIAVALTEMKVAPTPAAAPAGEVTFNVDNAGALPHEMVVIKTKKPADQLGTGSTVPETGKVGETGDMPAKSKKTLKLKLAAGHYALICNVPGHYAAGMHADFNVK